jgi:hypothetical protein
LILAGAKPVPLIPMQLVKPTTAQVATLCGTGRENKLIVGLVADAIIGRMLMQTIGQAILLNKRSIQSFVFVTGAP